MAINLLIQMLIKVENPNEAANENDNEQELRNAKENEEDIIFIEEINVRAATCNGSFSRRTQINTNELHYLSIYAYIKKKIGN